MATILKMTESRLPEVFPGGLNHFNAQNAKILGYNHFNGDYCLISYMPATVTVIEVFGNFQNHYVVFINDAPGSSYDYKWSVEYVFDNGNPPKIVLEDDDAKQIGTYFVDALDQGLTEAQISVLSEIKVRCSVSQSSVIKSNLLLAHTKGPSYAGVDALYDGIFPSFIAIAGNPKTTHLIANIVREYLPVKPTWYARSNSDAPGGQPSLVTEFDGISNQPPLNLPLAVMYGRMLKRKKNSYFPSPDTTYYNAINASTLSLFSIEKQNMVGPCAVTPHFAAMLLNKRPFQIIGYNNGSPITEATIFDDFNNNTTDETKIDIFNYSRFPRSSILLCAFMLKKLIEKAIIENYAYYDAKLGEIADWIADPVTALKNDKCVKNLFYEYINGPQESNTTPSAVVKSRRAKYKSILGRAHKHDWSKYISEILNITTDGLITDAYFARKKVAIAQNGDKTVSFERIDSSILGREEYIVIKTNNLTGQDIQCTVKTGDTILTGSNNIPLALIQNGASVTTFQAEVGGQGTLFDEDWPTYTNANSFNDQAIIKLGLRSIDENTFTTWNNNVQAGGAKLELEVKLVALPTSTPLVFLHNTGTEFTVGHLDKATVPRIIDAYFAKKVVTATLKSNVVINPNNPLTSNDYELAVIFEKIVPADGSYVLGREVFLVVETENFNEEEIRCYVMTGDNYLLGPSTLHQSLPVAPIIQDLDNLPNNLQPAFFSVAPIRSDNNLYLNTSALQDNQTPATIPYTEVSIGNLVGKAVIKFAFRPNPPINPNSNQTARAIFDTWAENIYRSPNHLARIELLVGPASQDFYVYYGENSYEEEAISGTGKVFLGDTGSEFFLQNKIMYEVFNERNTFNPYDYLRNNNAQLIDRDGNLIPQGQNGIQKLIGYLANDWARSAIYGPTDPRHNVVYYYRDMIDNEHFLLETEKHTSPAKYRGGTIEPSNLLKGNPLVPPNQLFNEDGVDADVLNFYQNGTWVTGIGSDRWYGVRGANGDTRSTYIAHLVNMDIENAQNADANDVFLSFNYEYFDPNDPTNVNNPNYIRVAYGFRRTRRRYIKPYAFAGLLGALAQFREDSQKLNHGAQNHLVAGGGFAYKDGSSFPSANHVNGQAGDLNLLSTHLDGRVEYLDTQTFDYLNQLVLIDLLYRYGWARQDDDDINTTLNNFGSEYFPNPNNTPPYLGFNAPIYNQNSQGVTIMPHCRQITVPRHNNHLHIEGFDVNSIELILP